MGQFFPQLIIFIIAIISFVITLMLTSFIAFCCSPKKSSKPGCCFIFWWIFFSLFFGVGLSYYILGMIETPLFLDDYPKIIEIIGNAIISIKNSYTQFSQDYFKLSISQFSGVEGSFGSFAVLSMNNNNIWKTDFISNKMTQLVAIISSNLTELMNNEQSYQNCDVNFNSIKDLSFSDSNTITDSLDKMTDSLVSINDNNNKNIQIIGKKMRNLLSDFIDALSKDPFINLPNILSNYYDIEIQKAVPSFDTDNNYYIAMRYLVFIIFVLLVIFYILQTITFSMNNSFSKCFVIASQPISLIFSILIGAIGVVTTSISCSISELCIESTDFASNFYSLKPDFVSFNIPMIDKELIFNSADNFLYEVLDISKILNFSQSNVEIKNELKSIKSSDILTFSEELKLLNNELKNNKYKDYLFDNLSVLVDFLLDARRKIIINNCMSDISLINQIILEANQLSFILQNEIPLITAATDSFLIYDGKTSNDIFISSFDVEKYIDIATLSSSLKSSLFTCPLRDSKKFFCEETGGTFSYFAIFSHFYLISLIGFALLLLCRRKSMLSNIDIDDHEDVSQNIEQNKTHRKWENQFISEDSSENGLSSSSDSQFDMFQQSHI